MRTRFLALPVILALAYGVYHAAAADPVVRIRHDAAAKQYAVTIDGKPFTTYEYGDQFPDKPIFYPVQGPNGARVNREFPMVKGVAGESTDHPHHQSVFFAYDEVNGIHFWNPDTSGRRIVERDATIDGPSLVAVLDWKDKDGHVLLEEAKRVTFGGAADVFWMDHDITLTAKIPVTFGDTKEGAFALRLNDTLKEAGGSGHFINAEGLGGGDVWGKTSPWVAIRGSVKDAAVAKDVTVAIFAHPSGLNFPPYWHARDYGLFAVNPFGRKSYDPKAPERTMNLAAGQNVHLRFRLSVYAGQVPTTRLEQDYSSAAK